MMISVLQKYKVAIKILMILTQHRMYLDFNLDASLSSGELVFAKGDYLSSKKMCEKIEINNMIIIMICISFILLTR